MSKKILNRCKHLIKDHYYCVKCGVLYHNKVSKNKIINNFCKLVIGLKTF